MDSVEEYLEEIERIKVEAKAATCIYRGEPNKKRGVESSAAGRIRRAIGGKRKNPLPTQSLIDYHNELLDEARQKGFGIAGGRELTDLELLAQFQHFGAATCLLDFTDNSLIALYFATEKVKKKDGTVFVLPKGKLHTANKKEPIRSIIVQEDEAVQWQPIRQGEAERRILNQSGVFIINLSYGHSELKKITIRADKKEALRRELREKYHISEDVLFTDFIGFAWSRSYNKPLSTYWSCFYRGNNHGKQGEFDKAVVAFDEAIRLKPDFTNAYNNRGNAKAELGQHEDAIADFDRAIELNPNDADLYYNRGVAKAYLEQYEDAIIDFDKSIELNPNDADLYYSRGVAKVEVDQPDAAKQDFEMALELAQKQRGQKLPTDIQQALADLDNLSEGNDS